MMTAVLTVSTRGKGGVQAYRRRFHHSSLLCRTLNPSPSAGRVRGLKGSTHLSPVHALHFGLADWVSTPAPGQLSINTQLPALFSYALTLSTVGIRTKKNPTHPESNPPLSHRRGNSGTPTPPGRGNKMFLHHSSALCAFFL